MKPKKFCFAQRVLMMITAFLMAFVNLPVQIFAEELETIATGENRALTVVLNAKVTE